MLAVNDLRTVWALQGKVCEDSSVLEEDLKPTTNQGLDTIPEAEPGGGSSKNKDRSGPSTASLCWLNYILGLELVGGAHAKVVLPVPAGSSSKDLSYVLMCVLMCPKTANR